MPTPWKQGEPGGLKLITELLKTAVALEGKQLQEKMVKAERQIKNAATLKARKQRNDAE